MGYLLEELRNPATLKAFQADIETANVFIGSLIFVQVGLLQNNCSYRLFTCFEPGVSVAR